MCRFPPDAAPDTSHASLTALGTRSTSLSLEAGHDMSRLSLLRNLLVAIERRYLLLKSGTVPNVEWSSRLETLHKQVTVTTVDQIVTGHAEGVDANGALLVRVADGSLQRILAGDVTLRIPS